MRSLAWLLRSLVASVHTFVGWAAYRLGCRQAARRHYERVLLLRGADFCAYVQLGRIAFDLGDYATWRRELEHARRLDPSRFARLQHPLELFEPRLAGTTFERPDADPAGFDGMRATWRTTRPTVGPRLTPSADSGLDAMLPGCDTPTDLSLPRLDAPSSSPLARSGAGDDMSPVDDCSSIAERMRLRQLGPIRATELRHCDLDDLLRRLSG